MILFYPMKQFLFDMFTCEGLLIVSVQQSFYFIWTHESCHRHPNAELWDDFALTLTLTGYFVNRWQFCS